MTEQTLKALRARARALGLRGYSRLTKAQLLKLLAGAGRAPARPVKRRIARAAAAEKKAKPHKPAAAKARAKHRPEPATALIARRETAAGIEESIEAAKYAVTRAGLAPGSRRLADLREDIERLPGAHVPQLGLLPQKPGVLHAYWALPEGADVTRARLRLCRLEDSAVEVIEEITLPTSSGHWYFHVPEGAGAWCVHLGQYDGSGHFVSSFERAIARLPTLYADGRPDRQWWIDEARFRAMYLRAGGVARGRRLGWPGSFSSR